MLQSVDILNSNVLNVVYEDTKTIPANDKKNPECVSTEKPFRARLRFHYNTKSTSLATSSFPGRFRWRSETNNETIGFECLSER